MKGWGGKMAKICPEQVKPIGVDRSTLLTVDWVTYGNKNIRKGLSGKRESQNRQK